MAQPILFAAPHRLPFLTGTAGLITLAAWWAAQLAGLHTPAGALPVRLLHAPAMLLIVYPAFIFGFLLTVFPRWMGQGDLTPRQFGPVSSGLAMGTVGVGIGLWTGNAVPFQTGFALFGAAWALALFPLATTIRRNGQAGKPPCWHAVSALGALGLGLAALVLVMLFVQTMDPRPLRLANVLALNGFVLPVFLTVAHRMVPFFAGNVVQGYERWRPEWLLAALWVLLLARIAGEALPLPPLSAAANSGLAAVTALMTFKWWPRAKAPSLLNVLIWGFTWAPVGFALNFLAQTGVPLGLAPTHALALGFAGGLMVAMVTRVTNGHSGRPLAMTRPAWLAFATIQMAALLRIASAIRFEQQQLLAITAVLFFAGLLPWLLGNAAIYLRRRIDGREG